MSLSGVCLQASLCLVLCLVLCLQEASASAPTTAAGSSQSTQPQRRQAGAVSLLGTLGALLPGLVANVAPLVLLFGIGALMMPALGGLGLLRESRRSGQEHQPTAANLHEAFAQYAGRPLQTTPQDFYYFTKRSFPSLLSQVNGHLLAGKFRELGERVLRAIDNADRRYS